LQKCKRAVHLNESIIQNLSTARNNILVAGHKELIGILVVLSFIAAKIKLCLTLKKYRANQKHENYESKMSHIESG